MELDAAQEQLIMKRRAKLEPKPTDFENGCKWGHRAFKGFLLLRQREVSSLLFNCVFCVFLGKMSGNKQNETN
jgi:hypothetical protein